MKQENYQVLVNGCLESKPSDQRGLYEHFRKFSMGICLRYLWNPDDAQDAMNMGFFKVFTNIHRYNPDVPLKGWIGRIMINTSINYLKQRNRREFSTKVTAKCGDVYPDTPEQQLYYKDLMHIITQLKGEYYQAFVLFVLEGYSHEEIAEKMSISEHSSKIIVHRAKKRLRELVRTLR